MAKSKIVITFSGIQTALDVLKFKNTTFDADPLYDDIDETFVDIRKGVYQTQIGVNNFTSASNYYNALIADYGNSGAYDISLYQNKVTITSVEPNVTFIDNGCDASNVSFVITNETEVLPISISTTTFTSFPGDLANKVTVNVLTNVLATSYDSNSNVGVANTLNPFTYSLLRGISDNLIVYDAGTNSDSKTIITPDVLAIGNVSVKTVNTPGGANVTINVINKNLLILEYSLDDVTWQSSNVFNGILVGTHTIYVKDQFGYKVNKDFTITIFIPDIKPITPFSYLSKAMSIRFKKDQVIDYVDILKTNENTLSCEEDVGVAYKYKQKFKPINLVTTQFLSNYENIAANIIKSDGTKVSLLVENKIKFLDIKDTRDARVYAIDTNKTGVYYTSGNTYNYNTSVVNGAYSLNGSLPDYAIIGNYINFPSEGWFEIEDIIYNELLNADVLVISREHIGADILKIISTNYNQNNYNVYEFKIDFSLYNESEVQVEILQSSPVADFEDINYLSEVIEVSNYFDRVVEIKWSSEEDTYVFYSTGITNVGNYEFVSFYLDKDYSFEIHKTPSTAVVVDSMNYELRKLVIEDIPSEITQQLIQASMSNYIEVNRLKFINHSAPETTVIDNTNLHSISLSLLKLP